MSKTIDVNLLSKEIMNALENYTDDISEEVEEVANKVGKDAVNELKKISPRGARGDYAKGWALKKDKRGRNLYTIKVWNKTNYQLTHLLEFGHATRNGGSTRPQPHIRPTEEKYKKEFEKELKRKIGGIK